MEIPREHCFKNITMQTATDLLLTWYMINVTCDIICQKKEKTVKTVSRIGMYGILLVRAEYSSIGHA